MKKKPLKVLQSMLFLVEKFLSKNKKPYFLSLLFITIISLSLTSLFFMTRGETPYTSELSFIEHSTLGIQAGSVIPASCDTGTPHDAEVCGIWTVTACGDQLACLSSTNGSHSYYCSGANTTPGCYKTAPAPISCAKITCTPRVGVSFSGAITFPSTSINSYKSSLTTVPYGSSATLSWTTSNASACVASSNIDPAETAIPLSAINSGSWTAPKLTSPADISVTYTLRCGNGYTEDSKSVTVNWTGSGVIYGGGGGCFVAGTTVLLGDGTFKNIENVTAYDSLMTSNGSQRVMKRYNIPYKGLVYAFNGDGHYFVTPTHPFMTTEGWKSLDPEGTRKESKGIQVTLLKLGDTLILRDNKIKILTQLDSKEVSTMVYNFGINGTHDFYADNYLVHNVDMGIILKAFVDKAFAFKPITGTDSIAP